MGSARRIAFAATVGNLLQGWDNAAIAGALLYLKPEFGLENNPALEGVVVASSLIGAWISTVCAGPCADWLGRRAILSVSAILFTISSCVMLWAPSVQVLVIARFLVGGGTGIAVTIVPIYIAETAPAEIRGQLSTLPQFMGSGGLLMAYVLCFFLSLTLSPSWRIMLSLLLAPSLLFLFLVLTGLPESPRWLVSKGRMLEAKKVLQQLRNKSDVAAELALLVEGLGVGGEESCLEEWMIEPVVENVNAKGSFMNGSSSTHVLYTPEEGKLSWIAKPIEEGDTSAVVVGSVGQLPRKATAESHSSMFMDPMVTVIGSLQQQQQQLQQQQQSFSAFSSAAAAAAAAGKEEESQIDEDDDANYDNDDGDIEEGNVVGDLDDEQLVKPLLEKKSNSKVVVGVRRQEEEDGYLPPPTTFQDQQLQFGSSYGALGRMGSNQQLLLSRHNSNRSVRGSFQQSVINIGESMPSVGIGGGWQLAWHWEEPQDCSSTKDPASFKRVFLLQDGAGTAGSSLPPSMSVSTLSLPNNVQAAALVGQPAQSSLNLISGGAGPAMVHPAETATVGPAWSDLLEGGVQRALFVGVSLQILQQFSGINAVLYFVPQILQQSGADIVLAKAGMKSESASILASGVTCVMMLPCIVLAMRLMDRTGRRQILLTTLPLLFLSLVVMVISNGVLEAGVVQAAASFAGVTIYVCTFVMGFGPIPNILGSEIFPTRVRGVCIGICQATMWTCNIILTNLFPTLLRELGIAGVFGSFAVIVIVAWLFTFLKVPETKGMPLEVISEFFALPAAAFTSNNNNNNNNSDKNNKFPTL